MILRTLLFDVIDGHSMKHNIAAPMLMRTFCSSMFQTSMFDVLTHHMKNVKFRHMKYSFSKGSQEICHYFLLVEEKKRNQIQLKKNCNISCDIRATKRHLKYSRLVLVLCN